MLVYIDNPMSHLKLTSEGENFPAVGIIILGISYIKESGIGSFLSDLTYVFRRQQEK